MISISPFSQCLKSTQKVSFLVFQKLSKLTIETFSAIFKYSDYYFFSDFQFILFFSWLEANSI